MSGPSESNVFIPLSDGIRLAATLYLPHGGGPWPALLEAYPYRKDDLSVWPDDYRRFRDEGGYAVCRLDLRGTGSSEGVAVAEYPPQEADDLCEVIAWLADQPWSSGAVGMFGTSYSGFNTIHAAMRQPPALRAIVVAYATDDRYTDDVHFGGGVRKAIEFGYPLSMVTRNALPPVPAYVPDWRQRWAERVDALEPWFGSIDEQDDGPFWRQGSLRPDYAAIDVPTMLIAGWADLYRNAALRMMEHLDVPRRLLLGPWSHMMPIDSIPGPRIDHVVEMLRWWDRWLRDVPNGVDREPPIAVFVQRSTAPAPEVAAMPGTWRYEPAWPPTRARSIDLPLAAAARTPAQFGERSSLEVEGDVGTTAHIRGHYPPPYGLPIDQRPDEARSLVFEWTIDEETEILGRPVLEACVRSSTPVAFLSAKLAEVVDGRSALVTRGILNLTHRDSDTDPTPVDPDRDHEVRIELDATSRVFPAGARLRLAIAGSDWPNAWPPPDAGRLDVVVARSRLVLPHVPGPSPVEELPDFVEISSPEIAVDPSTARWSIGHDVYARQRTVRVEQRTVTDPDPGCQAVYHETVEAGVRPDRPGDAWVRSAADAEIRWPEVTARAIAVLELRSDAARYEFDLRLDVFDDDVAFATRRWRRTVPRRLQ